MTVAPRCRIAVAIVLATGLLTGASRADSFRLENGRLITDGMSRIEVLSRAGPPLTTTLLSIGINGMPSREQWLYRAPGSISGAYWISVIFEGDTAIEVRAERER